MPFLLFAFLIKGGYNDRNRSSECKLNRNNILQFLRIWAYALILMRKQEILVQQKVYLMI